MFGKLQNSLQYALGDAVGNIVFYFLIFIMFNVIHLIYNVLMLTLVGQMSNGVHVLLLGVILSGGIVFICVLGLFSKHTATDPATGESYTYRGYQAIGDAGMTMFARTGLAMANRDASKFESHYLKNRARKTQLKDSLDKAKADARDKYDKFATKYDTNWENELKADQDYVTAAKEEIERFDMTVKNSQYFKLNQEEQAQFEKKMKERQELKKKIDETQKSINERVKEKENDLRSRYDARQHVKNIQEQIKPIDVGQVASDLRSSAIKGVGRVISGMTFADTIHESNTLKEYGSAVTKLYPNGKELNTNMFDEQINPNDIGWNDAIDEFIKVQYKNPDSFVASYSRACGISSSDPKLKENINSLLSKQYEIKSKTGIDLKYIQDGSKFIVCIPNSLKGSVSASYFKNINSRIEVTYT